MKTTAIKTVSIAFVMIFVFISVSWAQDGRNHRQRNQRARIHDGVRNGELTRGERRVLGHEQRKIQRYKNKARSDGYLSRREKQKIHRMKNRAGRHIYKLKHNNRNRHRNDHHYYSGYRSHRPRAFYRGSRYHSHGTYFSGSWCEPGFGFSFSTGRR